MSVLHDRITSQGYLSTPEYHPYGTRATAMVMPTSVIHYAGDTVLYGTAEPLVTADGAVIPAAGRVIYPSMVGAPPGMYGPAANMQGAVPVITTDGAVIPAGKP